MKQLQKFTQPNDFFPCLLRNQSQATRAGFISLLLQVAEPRIGGSSFAASRCKPAIVHWDSTAKLQLTSVFTSCLTCTDEMGCGTHRLALEKSPTPPPVGSQMTVFRLDWSANEVEQLHV
jgi:hypothetical protein